MRRGAPYLKRLRGKARFRRPCATVAHWAYGTPRCSARPAAESHLTAAGPSPQTSSQTTSPTDMTATTIALGDRLKDNDKRVTYDRTLTIEALHHAPDGSLEKVSARERPGSQLVHISAKRIHAGDKPRASGFPLFRQQPLEPRISALAWTASRARTCSPHSWKTTPSQRLSPRRLASPACGTA